MTIQHELKPLLSAFLYTTAILPIILLQTKLYGARSEKGKLFNLDNTNIAVNSTLRKCACLLVIIYTVGYNSLI